MKSKSDKKIEIKNVEGNVVISQDPKGGITSNSLNHLKSKRKRNLTISSIIIFLAAFVTILSYFKINIPIDTKEINPREIKRPNSTVDSLDGKTKTTKSQPIKRGSKIILEKKDKPIKIEKVEGDVVISQNQSGGITAHSINVNEVIEPEWSVGLSEKINDNMWRTKLTARGRGKLAYYNWNILLTLNTPVTKREDVPGEVSVGPWMPLEIRGGNISANQFFIGFSEFRPDQGFSSYLYSKEPLKILKVESLKNR